MMLLIVFKPWSDDISDLLKTGGEMHMSALSWYEVFEDFHAKLVRARLEYPDRVRPPTFSAAYWAHRTLRVIRNIDNQSLGRVDVNHALGLGMFSPPMMRLACDEVLAERGDHRSEHMHDNGWYSEQVMAKALEINTLYRWHMTPLWVNTDLLSLPREFIPGAVVHLRERRHWVALQADVSRNIVWLLDSLSPVGPLQLQWPEYVAYVYEHPNSYALLHVTSLGA